MTKTLEKFYEDNQTEVELRWAEFLSESDFGSGEDRIVISDEMFWEFVGNLYEGGL